MKRPFPAVSTLRFVAVLEQNKSVFAESGYVRYGALAPAIELCFIYFVRFGSQADMRLV
jgi:hypothetical protein